MGPNLVHIPDDLPFSAAIDDCSRPAFGKEACPVPQLVDVEPMITLAAKRVEDEMKKCTNLTNRVAPLVFSRFARGGKTTALCLLFDRLKKNNLNPIFISFNGSTGFKRREGETDCQAILRSIALQLIDLGERNPLNITCDEKELNAYLTKSLKPVVLIIDELNVLSVPVTADAGRMLRELFLDKENRYLVFSTHVPLDVDVRTDETPPTNTNVLMASPNVPPSPRLVHLATMPSCFDLTTLRAMSPACADLNPAEVAYFGGVPSLIYSVRMGDVDPKLRFSRVIKSSYFDENVPALKAFVDCVVTGKRSDLLPFFDQFGTVYRDRIRWPLCYIQCMLEVMPRNAGGNGVDFAQKCCESLRSDIGRTEKGLEWESIVNIALSFRCLQQSLSCTGSPFGVFKYGEKPLAMCVTMPGEIKTLQNARDFINEVINEKIEENEYVLLLVVPSYGKFPDSDGFVVTAKKLNDGTVREAMFPYQSKAGESYPSRKLPDGLVKGYLLRGKAPASAGLGKGWVYMSMNEVKDLLGVSLSPLYPLYWPVLPDAP